MLAVLALLVAAPQYSNISAAATVRQDRASLCAPGALPEQCDADVGVEVRRAFARKLAQMFVTPAPNAAPDLVFDVAVSRARLTPMAGFPDVEIEAHVSVRDASGATVAELTCNGGQQIFERLPEIAAAAFDKAAAVAADDFGDRFANSESIVSWLARRGIAVRHSHITGPARGDLVVFATFAPGFSVANDLRFALFAELGVSGRFFIVRGVYGSVGATSAHDSDISTQLLGIEVGPAIRLGRSFELHAGAGLNHASGTLTPSVPAQPGFSGDFSRTLPSAFAGSTYAFSEGPLAPLRLRVSVEARAYFDRDVIFDITREVTPVAGFAVVAGIGIEFPLVKSSLPPL
ncbi:MAG TPA: hypothetical protein VGH20_10640 [Myxococcales bacterium]|jgi:hypothetical protein